MKRFLSVILLCALVVLCGCQYSIDITDRGTETEGIEELLSDDADDAELDYSMSDGTTIAPDTIVDADGAVVRLLGITNTTEVPQLALVFDRGNREYMDFVVDYVKVNGWQVSGGAFPDDGLSIQSCSRYYQRFMGAISIFTSPLVECGLLDQIYEIEFGYQVTGTWREGVIDEGVYSITISQDGEETDFACDGPMLLETDDIKIQLYSFDHGTYYGEECEDMILYIENDSDRRIEVVIGDAEKYDGTDPEGEEDEEAERNVITRNEKNGKIVTSVPLYGDGNVCAESKTLAKLQTADEGGATLLSEDEVLSFSLSIYDYEEYNGDSQVDSICESTVLLTTEGIVSSD